MLKGLQSSGTRNDLNELSSNDSLSGSVEGDGEFVNHLSGVLGGIVHSRHPRALFRASSLLQGIVEKGCKTVFHVGLNDVSVKGVIHTHLGSVSHGILGEDGDFCGSVRNNRVVLVVKNFASVKFISTA